MEIAELLALAHNDNASDLHLSAGLPPLLRVDGEIKSIEVNPLDGKRLQDLLRSIMDDQQREEYDRHLELDFSVELPGVARFRVNAFNQLRGPGCTFRTIPSGVPALGDLNAPAILKDVCGARRGIVLVTGPTGSGKSTTLAAMVDHINETRHQHILTIENPIEFVHEPKNCLINQREVGRHTMGFSEALRSALREDPDVILIGEMRDLDTIRLALTAAETGHLVLATLHTSSAAKTIDRIVDVFPAAEKGMVRTMLSESLQAVLAQRLLKKIGGGRVAAWEIMIATAAVRNLIRENKIAQMNSVIQTGRAEGMQAGDQCLQELVRTGQIALEEARSHAEDKELFATETVAEETRLEVEESAAPRAGVVMLGKQPGQRRP